MREGREERGKGLRILTNCNAEPRPHLFGTVQEAVSKCP